MIGANLRSIILENGHDEEKPRKKSPRPSETSSPIADKEKP